MNIRATLIAALASCALLTAPNAAGSESLCLEAVQEKHYERLSTVCLELPHRNRMEKMRLLMSGDFTHYLGSIEQPSLAFALLKHSAEQGDANAQYMYSQLYRTVHVASAESWARHPGNNGSIARQQFNAQVQNESAKWLKLASQNGHTLALLEVAESMLLESYTKEDINLRQALRIARSAEVNNPSLAANLIVRLKKRISEY